MVCLGHSQVKVSLKLLGAVIIVGMDHLCVSHIGNGIIVFHDCLSCKYHIFIENGIFNKSALEPEFLPVIGTAYIGSKEGFNAQTL